MTVISSVASKLTKFSITEKRTLSPPAVYITRPRLPAVMDCVPSTMRFASATVFARMTIVQDPSPHGKPVP